MTDGRVRCYLADCFADVTHTVELTTKPGWWLPRTSRERIEQGVSYCEEHAYNVAALHQTSEFLADVKVVAL